MKSYLALTTFIAAVAGLDTTCTFHAQHYGTLSTDYESNLRHLGCADQMVGWGKASDVATTMAADYARALGIHITSSSLGGRYSCGSCLKVCSTSGNCEFVTVVDLGGGQLDLHPEIFYKLFGTSAPEAPKESYWADDKAAERYKGMGGHPACLVTVVGTENCKGHWKNGGGYKETTPTPEPEPEVKEPVQKEPEPKAPKEPEPAPAPVQTEQSEPQQPAPAPVPAPAPTKPAEAPKYEPAPAPKPQVQEPSDQDPVPDTPAPTKEEESPKAEAATYGNQSTCHPGLTCTPSDPSIFHMCTAFQTWTMAVAPGTECVCKPDGWADGDLCEGVIQHAGTGEKAEVSY